MRSHVEIETKYDVPSDALLPDLVGSANVRSSVSGAVMVLTATYYDTADHDLGSAGATLRRRTGGADDGWHLKLRLSGGERLELHRALGRGRTPPAALTGLVTAIVRTEAVVPVATLVTHRTVHQLLGEEGAVLAELADDSVTAQRHDVEAVDLAWREWEIELVDGDRSTLADLDASVRRSGIEPAASESKIGRVLGSAPTAAAADPTPIRRKDPAAKVMSVALQQALSELLAADPLVRLDRPGAVPRMSRALHRVRAVLSLRRQVVGDVSAPLAELTWLQSVISPAERLDAAAAQVVENVTAQPRDLVIGPVKRRLDRELAGSRRRQLTEVNAALDADRYLGMLDSLSELATRDAVGSASTARAVDVIPDLADRAVHRAERRIGQLVRAQSADEQRWLLGGAQRAVERARLAARLAAAASSGSRSRPEGILDEAAAALDELAVSRRAQELLRDAGVQAHLAGENGFTFGLLHGLEALRAVEVQRRLKVTRKHLKRLRKN